MRNTQRQIVSSNLVTVALADRALSFRLPDGATFADLADGVAHLGQSSAALPAAFYLKIDMSPAPVLPRRLVKFPARVGRPVLATDATSLN